MIEDDDEKKPIEPIPGQMCYDELLVPEAEGEEEEKIEQPLEGQMDIWELPPEETKKEVVKETESREQAKADAKEKIENKAKADAEKKTENQTKTEENELTKNKTEKAKITQNTEQFEEKQQNSIIENENNESENEFMKKDDEQMEMNLQEPQNEPKEGGEKEEKESSIGEVYGGGDGILYKPLEEVLHDSMIPYTEHVVLDRALPRVEDGLKPVQRRILYSMLELGLTPDKPYRKSARIVGDCMGKYHPHGDSSVYDAMVRMSQDFVLRAPLVDGHGNFGSIDGDSAAAMRYTEARMTPLAMELLRDLEKNTVRWGLNFDDTLKEPDVLPGRFPNLLVNGTSGIAVGVATNIPPHNLGEVIDGVVAYIQNPNITLDEMMKIIKGPDFPTGGELIYGDGLRSAYETGKGKITVRAKVGIEQNGDKQSLVITELPYQVNKALLLQKIAELKDKNKDKLSCLSEIRDESDRNGMRAVIRLKREANAQKILGFLFQSTNMQISYAINMVAIAGGKPKQLSLMEIISYYTAFQRDVVVRRTKFDLDVAKDRAHIVEGLLIAIKNIDAVIKIIKTSANVSEAKQRLRDKFKLSDKQAQAILDMRLARLVNLEVTKLEEELAALKERIKELEAILGSKKLQLEVVKREILEIKKKFATPRRSHEIHSEEINLTTIEEIEDTKDYLIAISAGRTVKKVSMKNYSKSQRNLTDNSTLFDVHTSILPVKATDTVLIFTDKGNCVKVQVDKLPECKWREKGMTLKNIDKEIDLMETPVAVLKAEGEGEVVFFTQSGMVKRSTLSDLVIAKGFYQAMRVADGDKVISVQLEVKGKTFVMFSKNGYVVNFEKSEVPVQGRVSGGVKGINLEDKDCVVFAGQNLYDNYTIITDNGYAKRLNALQIPISGRYRKGVKYINFEKSGKAVCYVGSSERVAVDQGLKFTSVETAKLNVTNDRLSSGTQIVSRKILGAYNFCD